MRMTFSMLCSFSLFVHGTNCMLLCFGEYYLNTLKYKYRLFITICIIQIWFGTTRGWEVNGELYAQRLQKLIYLHLSRDCFIKISLKSTWPYNLYNNIIIFTWLWNISLLFSLTYLNTMLPEEICLFNFVVSFYSQTMKGKVWNINHHCFWISNHVHFCIL